MLGHRCAGKGDEFAELVERSGTVLVQVGEDDDPGGMSAGFGPEGLFIGGLVENGGFGGCHGGEVFKVKKVEK